jgi:hypothetical protein
MPVLAPAKARGVEAVIVVVFEVVQWQRIFSAVGAGYKNS